MRSTELAAAISEVHTDALNRVIGVGHDSYASVSGEETQRFETENLTDHLTDLEEELLDTINWASMAILKLRAMREGTGA